MEALVELTGRGLQEWMNAAELVGRRIDAELPFLKQALNRLASFERDRGEVADTSLRAVRKHCP